MNMCSKLYVRPHLDYGDIYHNQRTDLMSLIELVQYKAVLIVSGCWHGTYRESLYDESNKVGSLSDRRWFRRLILYYKIYNGVTHSFLADLIP